MKRLWITVLCFLLLGGFCVANAADDTGFSIPDSMDLTGNLGSVASPAFGLWKSPPVESEDGTFLTGLGEQFPNGLWLYQFYDPTSEPCIRYGLLDRDGTVLLQPEYYAIYMLERCRGSFGAVSQREWLGNLLILIDESYQVRIFRCTGDEPTLLEECYDSIGDADWLYASTLPPADRIEYLQSCAEFYENFLPVYRQDQGYGLIGFDGELLVSCGYNRYDILAPTRIAMYRTNASGDLVCDLYDVNGKLVFTGPYTFISDYSEGLAAAKHNDGTVRFLSMNGSTAFTLDKLHSLPSSDNSGSFSDGLVRVELREDPIASSLRYVAYLDTNGNEVFSLKDYEDTYGVAFRNTGDFSNGTAYLSDYDWNGYYLTTDGDVRPLKYTPYFPAGHNGYALVDTDDDNVPDNVMNKWGSLLFAGPYEVASCASALEREDCHWVAITNTDTDLTAYFNLDTKYRTDFVYTHKYNAVTIYEDTQYLSVTREGKQGVLGPNAKEIVPAIFDSIFMPEEKCTYFTACRRTTRYGYTVATITLYDLQGNLLGDLDQFDQNLKNKPTESGFHYLYSNNHAGFVIVTSEGQILQPQADCYGRNGSQFSSGLLQAEYYDWSESSLTNIYGFLTEEGDFLPLMDSGNTSLPFDFYNTSVNMRYGSYQYSAYGEGSVVLYCKDWTPNCFLSVDRPSSDGQITLVESKPANGQNFLSRGLDTIKLTFNQEILLQDTGAIHLTCDLGSMSFHASAKGDTLTIYPDKAFYTGEVYTLTLEAHALSAANTDALISYFDGAEIQFKIAGVSTETLLTYHPEYLSQPEQLDLLYRNADQSLEKMMDAYRGANEGGEVISAFFYAAQNLTRMTADKLNQMVGDNGTAERLQDDLLDLFVSRALVDSAVTMDKEDYKHIQAYLNFCRGWDEVQYGMQLCDAVQSGIFAPAVQESGIIYPLADSMATLMLDDMHIILSFCASHKQELETFWNTQQDMYELRDKTMDELLGEYSLTLFNYVHMNRSAIDSLLRTLSTDSALYEGLQARRDALSGDALVEHLKELGRNELMLGLVCDAADSICKLMKKGGIGALNTFVDMAETFYQGITGKSEVDKYIQVSMMNGNARAVSTAVMEAQLNMLRAVNTQGKTTEQQRSDFKVAVNTKQQAYILLMELAAELVSQPEMLSRDCLTWAEQIATNGSFPEYLEFCKAEAAHLAASEVFPTPSATALSLLSAEHTLSIPQTILVEDGRPETRLVVDIAQGFEAPLEPDNVTSLMLIGSRAIEQGAFDGWSNVNSLLLGDVTAIESRAFADCALESVTIPETVTFIAFDAFAGTPLRQISGTTDLARDFAQSVGAVYLDLTVSPVLVFHAGYDPAGRQLFVVPNGDTAPAVTPARETLYFLSSVDYSPVALPL